MAPQQTVTVCWVKLSKSSELSLENTQELMVALPRPGDIKVFDNVAYKVLRVSDTPTLEAKIHIYVGEIDRE